MGRRDRGREARKTGKRGQLRVERILDAWDWVPRPDYPDDGEDFNVEVPASDDRPLERFLVQVKTALNRRMLADGSWSIPVEGKALTRYRTWRHPVFLVGVNLRDGECRWLDLSMALEAEAEDRIAKDMSFRIPRNHRFDESERGGFDEAVIAAFKRHGARFSSPAESLKYREQQLQSKDLRFAVHAALTDGQEHYTIAARETVPLRARLRLERREDTAALEQFIKYGLPAQINPAEFSITGSALFESLPIRTTRVTFASMRPPRRLQLGFMSDGVGTFDCVLDEDVEVTQGQHGFAVRLLNPEIPFHLTLKVDHVAMLAQFSFEVSIKGWRGHNVRALPFFEPVHRLLNGAVEHGNLALAGKHHGKASPPSLIPLAEEDALDALASARRSFNTVACLVRICEWAKSNIQWRTDDPAEGEIEGWIQGAKILDNELADIATERCTFTLSGDFDLSKWPGDATIHEFQIRTTQIVTAWSEVIAQIPVAITLRGFEVERNNEGVPYAFASRPGCSASIVLDRESGQPTEWTSPSLSPAPSPDNNHDFGV